MQTPDRGMRLDMVAPVLEAFIAGYPRCRWEARPAVQGRAGIQIPQTVQKGLDYTSIGDSVQ
jgi:hypothetical protein